jgi:hypothetical protein
VAQAHLASAAGALYVSLSLLLLMVIFMVTLGPASRHPSMSSASQSFLVHFVTDFKQLCWAWHLWQHQNSRQAHSSSSFGGKGTQSSEGSNERRPFKLLQQNGVAG